VSKQGVRAATLVAGIVAAALACAYAPAPARAAETGVNSALNQAVDGPATAQHLRVGWVRLFVGWSNAEPQRGRYDQFYFDWVRAEVARYRARGVKPLLVVSGTPAWAAGPRGFGLAPPRDPADFGRFMGQLVRLAPGIGAVEVWNEADDPAFFAGAPDPAGYAALLRAAYPAVKAADPGVTVLSTGLVGNNFRFLQDVYAAGGGNFFDAAAVHTDTACLLTSPRLYYREPDGRIGRFSFTGYREVHDVMAAHGDGGKGVWMTEIGWNTGSRGERSCRDGAVAGTRAEGVSEATQAKFLRLAYRCLAADPYVHVALWFSLQDVAAGPGYGNHLGLIRPGGTRKPAYAAMLDLRNGRGLSPARCGSPSDRVAPSLAVSRPFEGIVMTSDEDLPVRVSARDNRGGAGMRRIELFVNGGRVRLWGGGHVAGFWFGFRRLPFGTYRVSVRASDHAGNAAERSFTVRKVPPSAFGDRAKPRVRWRSVRRSGAGALLTLQVTDRGRAGLKKASLYVDGVRARMRRRAGIWRTRVALRGGGPHRLTVRAEDRAGNVARSQRTVG
jgi:hypothetical protein